MPTVNPEMLSLAREVRGVTQTDLATYIQIDQGRISRYEGGHQDISEEELQLIAQELSFPVSFFYQEGERHGAETGELFHRKRRTFSAKQRNRVDGFLNLFRLGMRNLLENINFETEFIVPEYDLYDFNGEAERVAEAVRVAWRMPAGPVKNLIAQLEAASCIVVSLDFGTDKLDEVVQWIKPEPPIILINSTAPSDRIRFSLAHALGHLVMHHNQIPYEGMEEEADRFASAFLMPADDIALELPPVTIDHMLQLKPYWKVSMQALIHRAYDLEIINERRYRSLFQMLSRVGYRKKEPFPITPERPSLVKQLREVYKENNYNDADLAELVRINLDDFRAWYYPEKAHLRLISE